MRVLIVNSVCGVGSTGRICTDLYDELIKKGHECCIAYGRGTSADKYNTYKISNKRDNYWHVFETRFFDNHGFASRVVTRKFVEYIKEYNPSVIHIHNLHGYYLNVQIFFDYLRTYKGKIIWTFHDEWVISDHEAYIYENQFDKTRFLEYPKTFIPKKGKLTLKERVFSDLTKNNVTIVSPSIWLSNSIKNSYLPYKVKVINNGINLDKFYPRENSSLLDKYSLGGKKIILGCSNIWDKRKGIEYFIELSQKISVEYQIVLIGKTKEKLPDNIIHIKKTESIDRLAEWYSLSYIFFNPTQMENFPTVNIESLACGTPILSFGKGGSGEVIDNEVGRIISSVDELLEMIDEVNFYYMRDKCLEKSQKYKSRIMVDKYIELYR